MMTSQIASKYVDSHVHAHEYEEGYISGLNKFIMIAVSDDLESSKKTISLSSKYDFLKPCVGIHPWKIAEANKETIKEIEKLLDEMDDPCIGEVGLDKKFTPHTFELQFDVFEKFLVLAKETEAILNLHAAGAWEEVANLVLKRDVSKAIFHWYTGPLELMSRLQESGFYISFNIAAMRQKKHADLILFTDLKKTLTESDGPYEYRGEKLITDRIPQLIDFMSSMLKIEKTALLSSIYENALSLFKR